MGPNSFSLLLRKHKKIKNTLKTPIKILIFTKKTIKIHTQKGLRTCLQTITFITQ